MKKVRIHLIGIIAFTLLCISGCKNGIGFLPDSSYHCEIEGVVVDRPLSDSVLLFTVSDKNNPFNEFTVISVKDGVFSFSFEYDTLYPYALAFKEDFEIDPHNLHYFFPYDGTIQFTLYPKGLAQNNAVEGNHISNDFYDFYYKKYLIEKRKLAAYTQNLGDLKRIEQIYSRVKNSDSAGTLGYIVYKQEMHVIEDSIYESRKRLCENVKEYIKENNDISSVLLYQLLIKDYIEAVRIGESQSMDLSKMIALKSFFSKELLQHPYMQENFALLSKIEEAGVGEKFEDYQLKALDGKVYSIHELVEGKYALIDIWATWCGSCIAKSIAMKPIYEQYKDRGFEIVGIASHYQKKEHINVIVENNNFPWLTLVDKPKNSEIREHYNIEKIGGSTFLIDDQGIIIAKSPSPKEVREILERELD